MIEDDDAISAWAQGLAPEGSPGEMSVMMRKAFGDENYERMVAQHETLTDLHISRQRSINNILTLVTFYGVVIVPLSIVAIVSIIIRNFF